MHYSNLISTTIPENVSVNIFQHIKKINNLLPNLVNLSPEELSSLPRVRHENIDFVHEVLEFSNDYPELIPSNIDMNEIKKDVELTESLLEILIPLKKLVKKLEENALLAGSEAYVPSMAIYNSIKTRTNQRKGKVLVS